MVEFFVQIFPLSMAPNVVTLLGLFFIIGNLMTVFYYDPYLNETQPTWCYFLCFWIIYVSNI